MRLTSTRAFLARFEDAILRWTLLLLICASVQSFHVGVVRTGERLHATALRAEKETNDHIMATSSRLSHVMLKVPSVDATVDYWTEKGGTVKISKEKPDAANGKAELMSAFIELGCSARPGDERQDPVCFALELVSTDKKEYSIGNVISHIGVSMLLQFQNNLLGAIKGDEKPKSQGEEPNGITVNSAASAPGDFFARLALKSNDLASTTEFYTSVLGMEAKAQDEKMLCLRYDNDSFSTSGVPTTLVFDATSEELDCGDCFDHLVVAIKCDIDELYTQITAGESRVFMKPTDMFGKQVMGVLDPNGYKVVICSV